MDLVRSPAQVLAFTNTWPRVYTEAFSYLLRADVALDIWSCYPSLAYQLTVVSLKATTITTKQTVFAVCSIAVALTAGATGAMADQGKLGSQTIGLAIPAPHESDNDLKLDGGGGPVIVFSCGASGAGTFSAGERGGTRGRCAVDLCVTAGNAGGGKLVVTLAQPGNAPAQRASFEIFPGFYGTACSANVTQIDLSCETSCTVTDLRIDQALINRSRFRWFAVGRRGLLLVRAGPQRFPITVIRRR